jgi:hypothetical protein
LGSPSSVFDSYARPQVCMRTAMLLGGSTNFEEDS